MKKQKKQPQLESQNLILYPLLPEQMNLLRDDPNELCRSLSLVPDDYAKYGEWAMLAEEQYRKMMADQEYMSFYTLWIITEKEDKHLVGYLYFLGRPSDTEAVELNGFIKPAYRRKGYMTEALNTLRGWAFANKGVTIMLAHPQRDDEIIEITYGIEDVPKPWWKSLYFAVQITLVDFTPFVWGGMFVSLAGLDAATVLPTMISACFLVMGICTLIQTTIGNRLPIVQGPSASLASSMGSVAATYGLPAVWGSVIVGGALETLLGGARIMSKIRKFLPPVVVGSVVAAIGYVAARIAVQWTFSSQDAKSLIMAAVAFLLALVLKFRGGKGLLSQGFILITVIIVGVVGASALGVFNWEAVHNAPWFALPKLFPYTGLEGQSGSTIAFVGAAIVGGFSGYIASMFESVGDYAATCAACDEVYRIKHIDRGIFAEGLGCVISAFFGGLPCTSYTQNIGIISATGVCSRRVTQIAGVIFLAYGLCPKLAYILSGIPRSVIGAVFLISAATIMFSGIDSIISDKRSLRNTLVAGTTLALAIMLPYHCASTYSAWAKSLPAFLNMLCTSTVFIAVVAGVLLNLILNYVLKDKNEK